MRITRDGRVIRTDMWREGKWLDLWSVVHLLSGVSSGFGFYFLHLGTLASVMLALLSFILYEMWEMVVQIEEASTNRFMDVVVGMVGFLPTFFLLAPPLSTTVFILGFGFVLTANVVMSVLGWYASQKAAALSKRLRTRFHNQRKRFRERRARLREKL